MELVATRREKPGAMEREYLLALSKNKFFDSMKNREPYKVLCFYVTASML